MLQRALLAIRGPICEPRLRAREPRPPRTEEEGEQPLRAPAPGDDLLRERIRDDEAARGDDRRHHAVRAQHRNTIAEPHPAAAVCRVARNRVRRCLDVSDALDLVLFQQFVDVRPPGIDQVVGNRASLRVACPDEPEPTLNGGLPIGRRPSATLCITSGAGCDVNSRRSQAA